jgi:hypothetical protein
LGNELPSKPPKKKDDKESIEKINQLKGMEKNFNKVSSLFADPLDNRPPPFLLDESIVQAGIV